MLPAGRRVWSVPSRLDALALLRAEIHELALTRGLSPGEADDLALCVHEAVSNAIVHGHRLDENLPVELLVDDRDGGLEVTVRDQGPGFDVEAALRRQAASGDGPRGRGLRIIAELADEYTWRDGGRELVFLKRPAGRD